jgi:cytolysin-activating lysine-acyltransferase
MTSTPTPDQAQSAIKELAKLPVLGPALWLYARDPQRKFTFIADIDWRLLPPMVLDQCKLMSKQELPWAFFTWAFVDSTVDQRLRSSHPVIAPHEWHCGDIPWLIDVVAPFGDAAILAAQVAKEIAPGKDVSAWLHNAGGQPVLQVLNANG